MSRFDRVLLHVAVLGSFVVTLTPGEALATSCALPESDFESVPSGATGVAVNSMIVLGDIQGVELTGARFIGPGGNEVPFSTNGMWSRVGAFYAHIPDSDLESNTTYVLSVDDVEAYRFTTGTNRDEDRPSSPVVLSSMTTRTSLVSFDLGIPGPGAMTASIVVESNDDRAFLLATGEPVDSIADANDSIVGMFVGDEIELEKAICAHSLNLGFVGSQDRIFLYSVDRAGNLSAAPTEVVLTAPLPFMSCNCAVVEKNDDVGATLGVGGILGLGLLATRRRRRVE